MCYLKRLTTGTNKKNFVEKRVEILNPSAANETKKTETRDRKKAGRKKPVNQRIRIMKKLFVLITPKLISCVFYRYKNNNVLDFES